jgi:hypothetical protein
VANTRVDDLLQRLPEIAKVVNEFKSESVQLRAFEALLGGFDFPTTKDTADQITPDPVHVDARLTPQRIPKESMAVPSEPPKTGKAKKKETPVTIVADLNLRPKGKKSLRDFYGEKKPRSNEQSFAVMVYYFEKILAITGITADHIYSAFKDLELRVPARLRTVMSNSATRHRWIDTRNLSDIKLTTHGENFVEHDLPRKPEK